MKLEQRTLPKYCYTALMSSFYDTFSKSCMEIILRRIHMQTTHSYGLCSNYLWNRFSLYYIISTFSRPGSVVAVVKLLFGKSANDPLKPLQDEITNGRLALFNVNPTLDVEPSILPTPTSIYKYCIHYCLFCWRT